jgi:hypothetical protein
MDMKKDMTKWKNERGEGWGGRGRVPRGATSGQEGTNQGGPQPRSPHHHLEKKGGGKGLEGMGREGVRGIMGVKAEVEEEQGNTRIVS